MAEMELVRDPARSHTHGASNVLPPMTAPARRVWAALVVVYVVWGSTYLGIKVVVETMPPLFSAGTRFLAAAALLGAILAVRGTGFRVTGRELAGASLVGLLLLTFGVGVVHIAETRIDSSVAAMIVGTVPLQIIVMRTLAGESPARATQLSTLAGLVGLVLVVAPGLGDGSTAFGLAIMVGSTIAWSTGSFVSRRLALPRDPFVAAFYEMGAGGVFLLVGALALGELSGLDVAAFSASSLLAWAYLVVLGSLVGFTAYAWLLRVAPISLVVTHQYVNPLVAIALGMLLLGERPAAWTLAGAALVIGAVYIAVRAESPARAPGPTRGGREAAAFRGARAVGARSADPHPAQSTSAQRGTPADPTASESPSVARR
jgi:drug/metabolite transporter (DMT)-like permease